MNGENSDVFPSASVTVADTMPDLVKLSGIVNAPSPPAVSVASRESPCPQYPASVFLELGGSTKTSISPLGVRHDASMDAREAPGLMGRASRGATIPLLAPSSSLIPSFSLRRMRLLVKRLRSVVAPVAWMPCILL